MLNFIFGDKNANTDLIFEESNQILKSLCILMNEYLLIGKLDGNLLIYDIKQKVRLYEDKISNKSINYLMAYSEDTLLFFSCSEEPEIKLFQLIIKENNIFLYLVSIFNIHESGVKRIKSLKNNNFVSCSNDSSLVIWNLKGESLFKLKNHSIGLENFIIIFNKNEINNLITLNNKGALCFYRNIDENLFLDKILLDIDYTSSYTMSKISKDKIFIGGYSSIQIISIKTFQIDTIIKIKEAISFIYESNPNFIVFGLKNGKLEFRDKNSLSILEEKKINFLEKDLKNFKYSNLFKEGEVKLFDNESVVSFGISNDLLICISDENIRFFNGSNEKKKANNKKKFYLF